MKRVTSKRLCPLFLLAPLLAVGCTTTPDQPVQQLARAETGIEFAAENGASEFASATLERAREHLRQAQNAAEDGEYDIALKAAEKAEADAELAAAQSNRRQSEAALEEIRESIDVLRREIARVRAG